MALNPSSINNLKTCLVEFKGFIDKHKAEYYYSDVAIGVNECKVLISALLKTNQTETRDKAIIYLIETARQIILYRWAYHVRCTL